MSRKALFGAIVLAAGTLFQAGGRQPMSGQEIAGRLITSMALYTFSGFGSTFFGGSTPDGPVLFRGQ
jgi:hypothetical protein